MKAAEFKAKTFTSSKLLIVDDETFNRQLLARHLNLDGFTELDFAENGLQALNKMGTGHYDLVLLDIEMPHMDGYKVLSEMHADARLRDVPVIVISGLEELESVVKCIELGAEDYLIKPFNPVLLRARINASLEKKELRDTETALRLALAEKNREMQDDLNMAAEFQAAILSAIPTTSFLQCAIKYCPYRGGVSGDVYDMSINHDGAANIFLGDATGHGVAAAIMTMMAQIGLDSLREDLSTDEIIRQLNSLFATRERDMSITGVFMRIAPSGNLSVTSAGHPPVIVVPVEGHTPVHLKAGGTPLGIFKEEIAPFVELKYDLKPGDKVFLYTDGITEWRNPEEDKFGLKRLTEFLMHNGDAQIDVTLNNLLNHLNQFAEGRPCDDDLTVLGIQYQPM